MADTTIQDLRISITAETNGVAETTTAINKLKKVVNSFNKIDTSGIHRVANSLKSLEKIDLSNLSGLNSINDLLNNISKTNTAKATKNITDFGEALGGEVTTSASEATIQIKKAGKEIESAGEKAKKSTSLFSKLWSSVVRIAFYRAIRSAMKSITSAIKEGTDSVYQWSKLMNGKFSQTMDNYATKLKLLKNSLGAALTPLLETLYPVFEKVINILVKVIDTINILVSALSGNNYWLKATEQVTEYAKATDKASKSLAGFDELNNIGGTSSSDDDSVSSTSYTKMELPSWAQWIHDNLEEIKTVGKLAAAFLAAYEAAKLLNGIFGDKNKTLSEQTSLTSTEIVKVLSMAGVFGLATSAATLLAKGVSDITSKLKESQGADWNWSVGLDTSAAYASFSKLYNYAKNFKLPTLALTVSLTWAYQTFENLKEKWFGTTDSIETENNSLYEKLKTIWNNGLTVLSGLYASFKTKHERNTTQLDTNTESVFSNMFKNINNTEESGLQTHTQKLLNAIVTLLGYWNSYSTNTQTGMNDLGSKVTESGNEQSKSLVDSLKGGLVTSYNNLCAWIEKYNWSKNNMRTGSLSLSSFFKTITFSAVSIASLIGSSLLKKVRGYASGGVITQPTLGLVGEYSGAKNNPEIISPRSMMLSTMYEANGGIQQSLYDVAGLVIEAINSKDMNTYLDGNEIGKASVNYINKQSRLKGASIV